MCGGQPFADCYICPDDAHPAVKKTFVRYGGRPLCKTHACALAGAPRDVPFVREALERAKLFEPQGAGGGTARALETPGATAGAPHKPTPAAGPLSPEDPAV
jgi:hypothetical protein